MNYKEKYEQAIENIKKIKAANKDDKELVDFIEYKYPELKESEDEKIRKALMQHIKDKVSVISGWREEELIAWLEKQGEYAWNEEDKKLINLTLQNLTELKNRYGEKYGKVGDCIQWIMSIKQTI